MGSDDEGKWWRRQVVSWGGSRSTKSCIFPCKVAVAGDERYLVCAAVAAAVVLYANSSPYVLVCVVPWDSSVVGCKLHWNGCFIVVIWCCHVRTFDVATCVDRCRFATGYCETHCHGCMNLHGLCFGKEAGARNCKIVAAGDERYLVCAAVAAAVVLCANCSSYVFCNEWLFLCA